MPHAEENSTRPSRGLSNIAHSLREGRPFAVIGNGVLWQGGEPVLCSASTLDDLGELAKRRRISQFWIHETALPALGLPASLGIGRGAASHFLERGEWTSSRQSELSAWSYWYRRGESGGFDLHVPAWSKESPFAGCRTAADLLLAVAAFDQATGGVRWCGSGAITSDNFIRRRIEPVPSEVPPPLEEGLARELAMVWHRPPTPADAGYRYCHALDLNLAYAAAASSLELPAGEVVFQDWPAFDKRVPGVYLFEWSAPWPSATPPPWNCSGEEGVSYGWVTAPTAERLVQCGLEPLEGWLWPSHGRHLRPWYAMLKEARAGLLEDRGPALEAVKQTCRMGLGRLASERRTLPRGAEYLEDDPTFQPYWCWAVVAETRARLHRRICGLEAGAGVVPLAVDTDCLYLLSSRPTPAALGAALGLPMGEGLGQFKAAGTAKAKDALEAAAGASESSSVVGRLRGLLK